MRIIHNTPNVGKAATGVGQVALKLAKAQNELFCDAQIWCYGEIEQKKWASISSGLAENRIVVFRRVGGLKVGFSFDMLSAARVEGANFNVVHQHGLWTTNSCVSNMLRQIHNIPVVIAPHGSLHQWALNRSLWKKSLALYFYERKNLHQAACLQATAEAEVSDFRDYGLTSPIAVIPNGVSETSLSSQGENQRFREQYDISSDYRLLLFLSRITPKKGLPLLLEAIDHIRDDFSGWLLVIAGTDEFNHLQEVKKLVEKLKLQNCVRFVGPLYDQVKLDAFAAADAFVLPSLSEGAPMVVLDSLARGVPVLTTQGTSWQSLLDWKCGWWAEVSTDGITQALTNMLSLSKDQLDAMGQRGLELVRSEYLWRTQGKKTLDLYKWLLGQQEKPDFVILD